MVSHSKRHFTRHEMPTDCVVVAESTGQLLADQVGDASYGGLFVRGDGDVRLGQRVRVSIRVPRSRLWLKGSGYVSRVVRGRRRGDLGPGFGVQLSQMDGMSRVLLASVMKGFPLAHPRRGGESRDYAAIVARIAGLSD